MDELIDRFLKYIYRKNTQSDKTIESYKNDLNQYKEYLLSQSIDSFESCDRLTFMNFLATLDHLKSSSIARKMSVYRSFYAYLAEYMGINENPLLGIQTPKKSKQIPDFLFVEEIQEFLNSYEDNKEDQYRDRILFTMMYACGLRVSECVSLEWNQIDLNNRIVHIRGKGDKDRLVPFYQGFEKELLEYELMQSDIYLLFHNATIDSSIKIAECDWQALQEALNDTYADFTKRLKALHSINIIEEHVCLLIKIGFTRYIIITFFC